MSAEITGAARFVGQRIARKEDRRLLTGRGTYTDDIVLPGMLHAAFVRSPMARAKIVSIDVEAARSFPGVIGVYTLQDLKPANPKVFSVHQAETIRFPNTPPLADTHVRFVGDPVVLVVAENRYIAEDAAALVDVQYDSEDPIVTCAQAKSGTPVHPGYEDNLGHSEQTPEDAELASIFANAAHVVTRTVSHHRQTQVPMETRGIVSQPTGIGELTVYISCQSTHQAARYFAKCFNFADHHVRVIAKDVGGGFGQKIQPHRDETAVVAASLLLGRPIKWIEDRLENLTAAYHAREQEITVKLALDRDGKVLAADLDYECNLGAYPMIVGSGGLITAMFSGPYKFPKLAFRARGYFTNTCGLGAYRGPWMMESLARETVMDEAARQIGMDPIELRRRNLIRHEDQPYTLPTGFVIDLVTPLETMDLALQKIDVQAFRAEQAEARKQGRYLGMGVAVYVEPTTMAFPGMLASEVAHVRIEPTGKVFAEMSTLSQGHGTQTTMAQVIADEIGVDVADVTILEGDSTRGGFGAAAGGSRQAVAGGGAAKTAAARVRSKVKTIAGHLLNANPDDVQIERGVVTVAGVSEVKTTVQRIAEVAYLDVDRLPAGMELGLESQSRYRPPSPIVWSNASHICVCEVDIETGMVKILRWIAAEDCGVLINPAIVEGQVSGGVAQAIGGVLFEHAGYDLAGNPTAVTFKDYLLPTILDVPEIEFAHLCTPSASEGGFKGVGEGGAIIGPPTLVNAIADALSPFGVSCLDLPLSPDRIVARLPS